MDSSSHLVFVVDGVGGSDEEMAAEYIKEMKKPVISFISGRTAPPGKRMGHAGAIISGRSGTPQAKVDALIAAGSQVVDTTAEIPGRVRELLGG